jgi:hypothetical protein
MIKVLISEDELLALYYKAIRLIDCLEGRGEYFSPLSFAHEVLLWVEEKRGQIARKENIIIEEG